MTTLFVEVLSRNGELRRRERFDALPIRVGRGYDNDLIIDDRHASPHHAVIEADASGALVIRDLDSRNGVLHDGARKSLLPLDGDTVVSIGHAHLRVRSADYDVGEAVPDTTFHRWEGWPPAVAGLLMLIATTLWGIRVADIERFEASRYVTAAAVVLTFGLVWCGLWALANRLFGAQLRFGRHLFIAACGYVALEIGAFACNAVAYAFSLEALARYSSHAIIAILLGIVYFHLLTINSAPRRGFALACVLFALLGSGIKLLFNYQNKGVVADSLYMTELLPPAMHLTGGRSSTEFLAAANSLKARADDERAKAVSAGGDDSD